MAFVFSKNLRAFVNTTFLLLLLCFFFTTHIRSPSPSFNLISTNLKSTSKGDGCIGLEKLFDHQSRCLYLKTHPPCISQGHVNYLYIFYCLCGSYPSLGYTLLAFWLLVLFYLLGNTASKYLCPSVESLSRKLRLSPSIAGVTLLQNTDVFASVVLFCSGSGEVGLSSVLGGSFFVSCVVVGIVNVCARSQVYDEPVVSITKEAPSDQGNNEEKEPSNYYIKFKSMASYYCQWLLDLIAMPLYLPRRLLTIPGVSEKRWCRLFAVASASFAPLLIAALWYSSKRTRIGITREGLTAIFLIASLVVLLLGAIALKTTNKGWPPKKGRLFPWLVGGFLMSVLWTHIIAEELVGLLVSLGYVFRVSPSILGLTVLSWGSSIWDLIANVAMAVSGGQDVVQIAISGCYSGPILNTLAGLGSSLVVTAWSAHPMPFVIPVGPALFEILGFMMGGLVWALVILPKRDMKLDSVLGIGLLAIYSCFLSFRLSQSLGLVKL